MPGQVIWITGLSGAGKTTLANSLNEHMRKRGLMPILLDGDELRKVFNCNEETIDPYSLKGRLSISIKYGLLCKSLSEQGFTVIIATVSMFKEVYAWNRINLPNYFEVYLDVPLKELRRRDPKKIYSKFNSGFIKNVCGLDLKVDQPTEADLTVIFQRDQTANEIVDIIIQKLNMK